MEKNTDCCNGTITIHMCINQQGDNYGLSWLQMDALAKRIELLVQLELHRYNSGIPFDPMVTWAYGPKCSNIYCKIIENKKVESASEA